MRHAYHVACQERPMAVWTESQRLILAKAIVVVYNPILSEAALLTAAFDLVAWPSRSDAWVAWASPEKYRKK